jgi:hypothetical protein
LRGFFISERDEFIRQSGEMKNAQPQSG